MRYVVVALAALLIVAAVAVAQDPGQPPSPAATPRASPPGEAPVPTATEPPVAPDIAAIHWRHSKALGQPFSRGRLIDGTQLPALGEDFFTWDPVYNRI